MIETLAVTLIPSVAGPVVSSLITRVLENRKRRKQCSMYYALLQRAPDDFVDEVIRLGASQGCWTEDFARRVLLLQRAPRRSSRLGEQPRSASVYQV